MQEYRGIKLPTQQVAVVNIWSLLIASSGKVV